MIAGDFVIVIDSQSCIYYTRGLCRGVAQSGSVPEWGSGGRWFKSSRPDQKNITSFN